MLRTTFITSIATLAIAAAAPGLAKPGGGNGGGGPQGGANAGAMGSAHGLGVGAGAASGPMSGGLGAAVRGDARINSQGSINASPRALDRANPNSAVRATDLQTGTRLRTSTNTNVNAKAKVRGETRIMASSVTKGMTVVDSGGASIGTITGVRTLGNGSVKSVQLTRPDGSVVNLDARSLNLSNGALTVSGVTPRVVTSQGLARASLNGQAHASTRSALTLAGRTTLTGLTTGLTVNNSAGIRLGTVSGIVTNRAGAVVGVRVALTGGRTVTLPASSLSMNGTTVVTTSTLSQ